MHLYMKVSPCHLFLLCVQLLLSAVKWHASLICSNPVRASGHKFKSVYSIICDAQHDFKTNAIQSKVYFMTTSCLPDWHQPWLLHYIIYKFPWLDVMGWLDGDRDKWHIVDFPKGDCFSPPIYNYNCHVSNCKSGHSCFVMLPNFH